MKNLSLALADAEAELVELYDARKTSDRKVIDRTTTDDLETVLDQRAGLL